MSWNPLRSRLGFTASHQRPAYTADAGGGRTAAYSTIASAVPVSVWPMGHNFALSEAFKRMDIVTDHAICTDRDLAAKAKDKIVIGTDEYIVEGSMKFEDPTVAPVTVYVMAVNKRIS